IGILPTKAAHEIMIEAGYEIPQSGKRVVMVVDRCFTVGPPGAHATGLAPGGGATGLAPAGGIAGHLGFREQIGTSTANDLELAGFEARPHCGDAGAKLVAAFADHQPKLP